MVGAFFIDIINAVVIQTVYGPAIPVIPDVRRMIRARTLRWALYFTASSTGRPSFTG